MSELVIRLADAPDAGPCGLCGGASAHAGPRLALAGGLATVCEDCGRRHAPALAALLALARTAETVGPVAQHAPWLPLAALLDLSHAAERYALARAGWGAVGGGGG
jgi:hypothetical protein